MGLLSPNGSIRCTAKSNLLNETKIKRYLLSSLMVNPDLDTTITDFMVILESIDYSKFEIFSNVAGEISARLLSSFLECEVLVIVPDRKRQTEDSTHIQEIEIIGSRKIPNSCQCCLGNSNNKTNLVKYLFEK